MNWKVLTPAILMVFLFGCGGTDGDDWIVRTTGDTVTVREAGALWTGLEAEERDLFIADEEPVESFILALARRSMINAELEASGLRLSDKVLRYESAWTRSALFIALADSLPAILMRGYDETDIEFFRSHMGSTVWFTDLSTGVQQGPQHLPELPPELVIALSTAEPGGSVQHEGRSFRLDSIAGTDSILLAETLADTVHVRRLAMSRMASAEAQRIIIEAEARALSETFIDTALVAAYAQVSGNLDSGSLDADAVILDGPTLSLTVGDLYWEIAFTAQSIPVSPASPEWLLYYLGNQVRLSAGASMFGERWPDEAARIREEGSRFGGETALEALYEQQVSSVVAVTDSMLHAEFESLSEPLLLPEQRVLEIGLVPEQNRVELRTALQNGDADAVRTLLQPYSSWEGFDTGSLVSSAVTASMVPEAMGSIVFSADPADTTTWFGPIETQHGSMMVYRTAQVLPREQATFEEATDWLEARVRQQLEEARTLEWMAELEESMGLEINRAILSDLPADPALWAEL